MNMRVLLIPVFAILFFVVGCDNQGEYSYEINTLDSLYTELEKAEEVFENIPHDTTVKTLASIKKDLEYVQKTYEGDMKKDMALKLADYRTASRLGKNYGRRYQRIDSEIDRTKSQLRGLKEALETGATEDKQGTEITESYIRKAFDQEKKLAEHLIAEIYEMKEQVERMHVKYAELYPTVVPILDSLKRTNP